MLLHQRIRRESGPEQMEAITSPASAAGGGMSACNQRDLPVPQLQITPGSHYSPV